MYILCISMSNQILSEDYLITLEQTLMLEWSFQMCFYYEWPFVLFLTICSRFVSIRALLKICALFVRNSAPFVRNVSVISLRSVLLVEETDKLYHILLYRVHFAWTGFKLTTLVVMGTDCTGSCKSNYHAITTTTIYT